MKRGYVVLVVLGVILLFFIVSGNLTLSKDNFTDCPYYGSWPPAGDCGAWVDYLSSGYPTVSERGKQATNMTYDNEWLKVCTDDQMDQIANNSYAYGLNSWNVEIAVEAIKGNIKNKKTLCNIAKTIMTPPSNKCQIDDWKNNYMSAMTSDVQSTLNLWRSYGC